jgi:hypothetical protein
MAELGWFHVERAELIEGEILVLSPQGPSHSYLTDHVAAVLRESGWTGVWVRMQLPISFGPTPIPSRTFLLSWDRVRTIARLTPPPRS